MALTEQQLDELVEEILSGRQERFLEELTESAINRFEKAAAGIGGTQTAEAQLEHLARDWPDEARRILAKYSAVITDEVAESVEKTLMDSYKEDEAAMQAYIATGAEVASAYAAGATTVAFTRRAAQAAQGIASIIRRQNILMEETAEKIWYETCEEVVNRAVIGTMPEREIIAKGVEKMGDIGYVTYGKNGKKTVSNFVDVAIRRHIKTQTAQAGARMTTALLDSYGHDLVITDSHWGARPEHAEWQGKPCCMKGRKKVDGVEYPDIRDLTGYGTVTGLLGANCQHSINPYYPGITPLPDRDFKEFEKHYGITSDEYYEATQKQRTWECRIRKTKREIAAMESAGVGLESPTYVQKRLVLGRQQASIAKLCKEKKLPRQYAREKAYGVSNQPRALKVKPAMHSNIKKVAPEDLFKWINEKVSNLSSKDAVAKFLMDEHGITVSDSFRSFSLAQQRSIAAGIDNAIREFGDADIGTVAAFRSTKYAGEYSAERRIMKINPSQDTYLAAYHETIHAIDAEKSARMPGFLQNRSAEAYNLYSISVVKRAIAESGLQGDDLEKALFSIFYSDINTYRKNRSNPWEITASALEQRSTGKHNKLIDMIARLF